MERSIRTRKEHRKGASVLLSNLYLHYVLNLWFERVVKSRLRDEARLVRHIDDFAICFQYRSTLSVFRTPYAFGWESSASLLSRPSPNWLSLVGSRSDTQTRQKTPGD